MSLRQPQHSLDQLLAQAEGFAEFAMRQIGHVPPTLLAVSPDGPIHFMPKSLGDNEAKNSFANTARLICLAHDVTAAVLVLESWMKKAKAGEPLDLTEPLSEAFDRSEVVVLLGEAIGRNQQKFLPIIRSDNGNFFGFGEYDGASLERFEGRFAQILPPKRPDDQGRTLAKAMLKMMGVTESSLRE